MSGDVLGAGHVGWLGALLLLLRQRLAVPALMVSFVSMAVTFFHNFGPSEDLEIMGARGTAFSGLMFVVALGPWLHARPMAKKEVLA